MKIRNFAFGKKDKEMKLRFICIMAAFLFCISCNSQNNVVIISPQEYATAIDSDTSAIVLDVRQKADICKEQSCLTFSTKACKVWTNRKLITSIAEADAEVIRRQTGC